MTPLHCTILCDEMVFCLFVQFLHNIEITRGSLLEKNMDIAKYFKKSNDKLDGRELNCFVTCSSTSPGLSAAREMNSVQEEQDRKKKRLVLPEKVKKDVAYYAWKHGNPEGRRWASKKYSYYTFKRETVRDSKVKYQKTFESNGRGIFFALPRQGRPSKMSGEITTEVKSILHHLRVSGEAVTRKTVIAKGKGVLKARCPEMLEENGGSITLATKWARGVLKSLDCVKRRYTTAKREMNTALYEELTFSWKREIANAIFEHRIQKEMILSFDQTALGFTAPNKYTLTGKGVHSLPIANVNEKGQITATFCVNIVDDFLPVQLIYGSVSDNCHPKVKFPESFRITHSQNHWSNEDIVMEYLKKIIFPYIKSKRQDAKALLIFDVFKGQTTSAVINLLKRNDIIAIHVPNNHSNLSQTLDISVNKSAKCFIAGKYQDWYAE